ncbi:MAG: type II toxin-antitoxin system Phd/YefM family antitoxin [Planctomycetes bacterium]|nr:type II toxin-antitoxin system Phd/YefM family antitoxin [Planctomycetota bacterium]
MRSVGIKSLKDKLSEYVRIAAAGETVLVTDRDRVVAELVPPRPGRAEGVSDVVVAEGVRSGWITPRRYPPSAVTEAPAGSRALADVLADLDQDREDRGTDTRR